ncbi:MAG: ABC transporter ATP-binding protein [Clostridiales bacterium]|nr:ABC transporter ATP-binding protein [Clostridiales bacterium]
MKRIFKNLTFRDYILILITISAIISQTYFEMEFIGYTASIVGLVGTGATGADYWAVGYRMIIVGLIVFISAFIKTALASFISSRLAKNLRREVFDKVNSFSSVEINKFSTSSLITRSTNDITQVQRTFQQMLTMMFMAPCMAIFAILRITESSLELSLTSLSFLVVMLSLLITMLFFVLPKFNIMQKNTDRLNLVTRENLTGIRVVRAYNGEKYQEQKFEDANETLTKTNLFLNRVMSLLNPSLSLIMNGMSLSIYWVGAHLVNIGSLRYAQITAFTQFSMHIIMSFMFITLMFVMIPRGIVSLRRINEILDTENSIKDGEIDKSEALGTIEFRDVSFIYPNAEEPVLENISFKVNKGETVAFIGSTGSGKSTLINLIPRFYDTTSGQVLVDGIDVKAYKLETLHDKIGYVPQKANLFSGDILSNMKVAKDDINDDEIERALSIAQCTFIEKLDDGYTHTVAQGGKNFSGGQKQRLSIARAIAKKPEIFIFDDSFSALDFKTDKTLRAELKKNIKDTTTLIVAQRVSTIANADKIVVLDDGKMVGIGTHKELLKNNKVYQEIYDSQTKKEVM